MPRQIFKGKVLCAAGPLPGQLTVANLKHWTSLRKGEFSDELDERTTHLLCTREQFKKRVPRVKEALKRGKRFHIVHYDWFEFSTVHEKREPEKEFSMRQVIAKQNAKRRELARIEKGKKDGEKFVNTNFFHIYHDRNFFPYQIDITRDDEAAGNLGQRYTLTIWESDAKPHLYWFTAKFLKKKGDSQPSYHRPSSCSGKWRQEMDLFMDFFHKKTGVEWEERVMKQQTMPGSFFQYLPPTGGKPVGRRLRFDYDYCLEINAQIRGLPWPPVEPEAPPTEDDAEIAAPVPNSPLGAEVEDPMPMHLDVQSECNEQSDHEGDLEMNGTPRSSVDGSSSPKETQLDHMGSQESASNNYSTIYNYTPSSHDSEDVIRVSISNEDLHDNVYKCSEIRTTQSDCVGKTEEVVVMGSSPEEEPN